MVMCVMNRWPWLKNKLQSRTELGAVSLSVALCPSALQNTMRLWGVKSSQWNHLRELSRFPKENRQRPA